MTGLSEPQLRERRRNVDSSFTSVYTLEGREPSAEMLVIGELFATGCIDHHDLRTVVDALVEHDKRVASTSQED